MKERTAQQRGYDFEKEWADVLGAKVTKGSGNQWWARMDVPDGVFLWSLKATTKKGFRLTKGLMQEVWTAIVGLGGKGEAEAGMAIDIDGDKFVVIPAETFARLMRENVKYIKPTKADVKRASSKVPLLMRGDDDEA